MEEVCYLCGKSGNFHKLFKKNCNHEKACYDCLRERYVHQPKHASSFPLKCFHPGCTRIIGAHQMIRLCETEFELERYHRFSCEAKDIQNRGQNFPRWEEIMDIKNALGEDFVLCNHCGHLATVEFTEYEREIGERYGWYGKCWGARCVCRRYVRWRDCKLIDQKIDMDRERYPCKYLISLSDEEKNRSNPPTRTKNKDLPTLQFIDEENSYDGSEDAVNDSLDCPAPSIPSGRACVSDFIPDKRQIICDNDTPNNMGTPTGNNGKSSALQPSSNRIESSVEDNDWEYCKIDNFDNCSTVETDIVKHDDATISSQWEEISDVSSVITIQSELHHLSFADAVRQQATNQSIKQSKKSHITTTALTNQHPLPNAPVAEEDQRIDDEDDDVDWISFRDGMKDARGGKYRYRYNHENKQKTKRWERRLKKKLQSNKRYM